MKFAAFDLETAKPIPDDAKNLKQYFPLGISCAALAYSDREPVVFWQGVPQLEKAASQKIVGELQRIINNGYTLLTWNGCSFDFSVLAQESGMIEECGCLALQHVDLMLLVTFMKGHFLSLDKALVGAGLSGKATTLTLSDGMLITNMSGAMAPRLWASREYEAVLEYLRADVVQLIELAKVVVTRKRIEWTSSSGRPQSVPVSKLFSVRDCFDIPKPDVSWMDSPPSRDQFVEWIPNWRRKLLESPTLTSRELLTTDAPKTMQSDNGVALGVKGTLDARDGGSASTEDEVRTSPAEESDSDILVDLDIEPVELWLLNLCLAYVKQQESELDICASELGYSLAAAGISEHLVTLTVWDYELTAAENVIVTTLNSLPEAPTPEQMQLEISDPVIGDDGTRLSELTQYRPELQKLLRFIRTESRTIELARQVESLKQRLGRLETETMPEFEGELLRLEDETLAALEERVDTIESELGERVDTLESERLSKIDERLGAIEDINLNVWAKFKELEERERRTFLSPLKRYPWLYNGLHFLSSLAVVMGFLGLALEVVAYLSSHETPDPQWMLYSALFLLGGWIVWDATDSGQGSNYSEPHGWVP